MKTEGHKNGERHAEEKKNGDVAKQSKSGLKPGDFTWIKLRGASWWPAQVVEENAVSGSAKPRKRKSGEILVRLYGTYEYSYMDPVARRMEFENVLKKHNGSQREIFEKTLKQDLCELHSARSKKRTTKATGETKTENGHAVKEKAVPAKGATDKKDEDITPGKSGGTARRLKVMQGLGLTAPSGSPFMKNGQILSTLQ